MPHTHKSKLAEAVQRQHAQMRARAAPRLTPPLALLLGVGIGLAIWVVFAAVFWVLN